MANYYTYGEIPDLRGMFYDEGYGGLGSFYTPPEAVASTNTVVPFPEEPDGTIIVDNFDRFRPISETPEVEYAQPMPMDEPISPLTQVESIQPTEENEVLAPVGDGVDEGRDAAEDSEVERIAKILGVPVSQVEKYANKPIDLAGYSYSGPETLSDEQLAANQKMGALFSLIDPSAFPAMNFQVGDAAFGGGASGAPTVPASYRRNLAPETVGGEGSLYEEGALEAAKTRASDPTAGLWKQGFEQLIAENPDTTQQAIKSKAEKDLGALSKVEESYDVMKPLSDLLKANRFEEAFDYAKEKGVMNEIMNSSWLKQLRQPFTQDEAKAFYNAIPKEFAGSDFNFDANKGSAVYEGGYPDPGSVFTKKPDNNSAFSSREYLRRISKNLATRDISSGMSLSDLPLV